MPNFGFVFCCFNNSYKITSEVFEVWMKILTAVPGSVLWLLEGDALVPTNLRTEARARGVDPKRLVFAGRAELSDHLARHRLADLFLDTFPVNAHTTASDALWAGCPVLTLAGDTFIGRVAGSLLRAVGLPELIATTSEQYQQLAIDIARRPDRLKSLHDRLRSSLKTSPLFDATLFARNIERTFEQMWAIHVAGEKPRPFRLDT